MAAPAVERRGLSVNEKLIGILVVGAAVSVLLGVYANSHDPTHEQPYTLFFTATVNLKVWFATVAVILAVVQVLLALRIYGKISWPEHAPSWIGDAHRLTGTLAFLFTLPVAFQCLWSLGFQSHDMAGSSSTRVLIHSITGCVFYGAFVMKVLSVRATKMPGWLLPVVGGLVFAALVVLFFTSSVWFFGNHGSQPLF